jgi:hypothetical protein
MQGRIDYIGALQKPGGKPMKKQKVIYTEGEIGRADAV